MLYGCSGATANTSVFSSRASCTCGRCVVPATHASASETATVCGCRPQPCAHLRRQARVGGDSALRGQLAQRVRLVHRQRGQLRHPLVRHAHVRVPPAAGAAVERNEVSLQGKGKWRMPRSHSRKHNTLVQPLTATRWWSLRALSAAGNCGDVPERMCATADRERPRGAGVRTRAPAR